MGTNKEWSADSMWKRQTSKQENYSILLCFIQPDLIEQAGQLGVRVESNQGHPAGCGRDFGLLQL
jgi:hypothetical protein